MFKEINGVYHGATVPGTFEQDYLGARAKEGRVYTDEIVGRLPAIGADSPLYTEWQIRARSAERLAAYCQKKGLQRILEIGCGNGWLSHLLSQAPDSEVVGTDVNLLELEQGARVFKKENLSFVYDIFSPGFLPGQYFDMILFAASIQYFADLKAILETAKAKLTAKGEIHIADTFFYGSEEERQAAATRTQHYYTALGYPAMSTQYFHHTRADLKGFDYQVLYDPKQLINVFRRKAEPFPWVMVK